MSDCVPYAIHMITGIDFDTVKAQAQEVGFDPADGMSPIAGWSLLKSMGCSITSMQSPGSKNTFSQVLKTLDPSRSYILSTRDHWVSVANGQVFDKADTHGRTVVRHVFEIISVPPVIQTEVSQEGGSEKPKPLTVNALASLMAGAARQGMGHRKIRLRIERGTVAMGGGHSVDVVDTSAGFDWNSGSVFLETSEPLGITDQKLARLGATVTRSTELIYRLTSILEDSRYSDAAKIELATQWIAKHRSRQG